MTYAELRAWIDTLTPEQQNQDVTIYMSDIDETSPIFRAVFNTKEDMGEVLDTLDENHPMLTM